MQTNVWKTSDINDGNNSMNINILFNRVYF